MVSGAMQRFFSLFSWPNLFGFIVEGMFERVMFENASPDGRLGLSWSVCARVRAWDPCASSVTIEKYFN